MVNLDPRANLLIPKIVHQNLEHFLYFTQSYKYVSIGSIVHYVVVIWVVTQCSPQN